MWGSYTQLLLPAASLLLGWLLGLFSNLWLERVRRQQWIASKLFDQYVKVRGDITEVVSRLAVQRFDEGACSRDLQDAKMQAWQLFYEGYDFLPTPALLDLPCLYSLASGGKRLYICDRDHKLNHLDLNDPRELSRFANRLSPFTNVNHYAILALMSKDESIKQTAIVNYQSRHLLQTLNEQFRLDQLLKWETIMVKQPISRSRTSSGP